MTITTELYIDEPIVFVTIEGLIDEMQVEKMHQEMLAACDQLGVCFILVDLRATQATIHECLTLLMAEPMMTLYRDGKVHIAIIGSPSPEESLKNISYPIFVDQETALNHIRFQIATHSED